MTRDELINIIGLDRVEELEDIPAVCRNAAQAPGGVEWVQRLDLDGDYEEAAAIYWLTLEEQEQFAAADDQGLDWDSPEPHHYTLDDEPDAARVR